MNEEHFDPSLNFLYRRHRQLDHIFQPKKVAVVGATEKPGSVGSTVMQNLLNSAFQGEVIPINPKRPTVLGKKAYPDLKSAPSGIELIVVVTPAAAVPQIISDAADLRIPAAIVISAGFKEIGESGMALERQILAHARRGAMRIIGPNCLGVMNPNIGFNATFAAGIAAPGNIAFISQSGALCTGVLDWSLREKVGFSSFVSIGSMVDVDWGDLINYFGNDPWTKSILIYMESVGNPRSFLSAAREVALSKPIILIKAGRTQESAKAAASHTGALTGSDEVFSAALERVGILRVDSISELFGMAGALAKQPRPRGPHLSIVTNAGGPGVIATDALIQHGGKLTELSQESVLAFNQFLPPQWSHNNPIDVLGDANAEKYGKAVEMAMNDPESDGVLVILTPQDMTDSAGTALALQPFAKSEKPLLASWMGAGSVEKGIEILKEAGIPTFEYPDEACKTFGLMWKYSDQLRDIYETPDLSEQSDKIDHKEIEKIFNGAKLEKRTLLDEYESKKVLEACGIPTVPTVIATNAKEAVEAAKKFGFPVVLKLYSRTITHKTDVGGVKLNLNHGDAVLIAYEEIHTAVKKLKGLEHFQGVTVQPMIKLLNGYELILGSSLDAEFGPVVLFGSGGQLVEVYKDRALAIPPLTTTLARLMMKHTKIYEALKGVRGRESVDLKALENLLVRFSTLIVEAPQIKECDINPLFVGPNQLIALDARIVLHEDGEELSKPAIRPYPTQYVKHWKAKNGQEFILRPIRPEDEHLLLKFHEDLSQETVRQRYLKSMHYKERTQHERLLRICFNDYDREIALVAEEPKAHEIVGVARLTKIPATKDARFALIVKDRWQHQGVGKELMQNILQIAKNEHIELLAASFLEENTQMQKLLTHLGFSIQKEGKYNLATKKLETAIEF